MKQLQKGTSVTQIQEKMSNFAPAAEWAIKILEIIAASDKPLGITDISKSIGINKNMVFRVINSLENAGWVYVENADEKKYHLTLRPFHITHHAAERLDISTTSMPYIYQLWKTWGESTYLGILKENKVLYIQHLDSTHDIRVSGSLGGTYDLYCSAPGKVLLAYSDDTYIASYLKQPLQSRTNNTLTDPNLLMQELEAIRKQGYAIDNEEGTRGILCIAAPIFNVDGHVLGTVGCSFTTLTHSKESLLDGCGHDVIQTAKEISSCYGLILEKKTPQNFN